MLIHASFVPHPPIIIPEIGQGHIQKVEHTISALKTLGAEMRKKRPETIIVVSPHGQITAKHFNISGASKLTGDFLQFGHSELQRSLLNDSSLASKINQEAKKEHLPLVMNHNPFLDHGILVPLYYLAADFKFKIIFLNYSGLDINAHLRLGQLLRQMIDQSPKRIAFVASGDLSHGLNLEAPAGFSPVGKKFDQKIVDALKHKDAPAIINLETGFVEQAAECGYRSLLILLGVLQGADYRPQVLSYEGPFGVGYLVANFKL